MLRSREAAALTSLYSFLLLGMKDQPCERHRLLRAHLVHCNKSTVPRVRASGRHDTPCTPHDRSPPNRTVRQTRRTPMASSWRTPGVESGTNTRSGESRSHTMGRMTCQPACSAKRTPLDLFAQFMREISETDVRRLHIRTVRYPTTSRPHDVRRTTTTFGRVMLNACVVCEEHSARHNLNAQPRLSAARSEHEMAEMPRAPPFKFCLSALCLIFHPCSPGGWHSDPCADLYSTACDGVDTSNKLCMQHRD